MARIAREDFEWFKEWDQTLDESNAPFYQWFVGGKVNIVHNAWIATRARGGATRSRCCGR